MEAAYSVILASGSPRRKEILTLAGVRYTVVKSEADEDCAETRPEVLVRILAQRKAQEVAARLQGQADILPPAPYLILGADTVVSFEDEIFGKPHDAAEAEEMLLRLQGQTHSVFTGVCLLFEGLSESDGSASPATAQVSSGASAFWVSERAGLGSLTERCFSVETKVTFAPVKREVIARYVATGEPFDKAGGYAIQGGFAPYITEIHGDYYNVVGLPIAQIFRVCGELGVQLR